MSEGGGLVARASLQNRVLTPYFLRASYTGQPCREGHLCDAISRVPFDRIGRNFGTFEMGSFSLCCVGLICEKGVLTPYFLRTSYTGHPYLYNTISRVLFVQIGRDLNTIEMMSFSLCCLEQICKIGVLTLYFLRTSYTGHPYQ